MKRLGFWLKVVFIQITGLTTIIFYESCCGLPEFPFYEVTSFDLNAIKSQLTTQDTLKLFPVATNYRYLSSSGILPNAYAWQCETNGYEGSKFRFTSLNVTSNKAFDDNHPAGASLNDLFGLLSWSSTNKIYSLAVPSPADSLMLNGYYLFSVDRPMGDLEHILTIKINNENNTQLSASSTVIWN